jgi:hypothetical protein
METALRVLHAACAAVLLAAHSAFYFRGLPIEAGRIEPGKLDHLARRLSQVLLPIAALSGLIIRLAAAGSGGGSEVSVPPLSVLHLLLGLAPLAAIPIVFFGRVALKKRRQAPWLLPAVNLTLLSAAFGTGIFLWR